MFMRSLHLDKSIDGGDGATVGAGLVARNNSLMANGLRTIMQSMQGVTPWQVATLSVVAGSGQGPWVRPSVASPPRG